MKRSQFVLTGLMILLYAAFISIGVGYTQGDYPDYGPIDTGTPGLVEGMDDLNLPLVPPPPDSPPPPPTPAQVAPQILPNTPTTPPTSLNLPDVRTLGGAITTRLVTSRQTASLGSGSTINAFSDHPFGVKTNIRRVTANDTRVAPHRQPGAPLFSYTNPTTGSTMNVFSDYTFEVTDESGTSMMAGNIGMVGDVDLIAVGETNDGTRYAFHARHFSAFTPDGDVLIGNAAIDYTYHFDQDGTFLSLTDSVGGEYQVESDDSGGVSINGPDGYKVQADETGAFELYDGAGNLVVVGELFDTSNDEFAGFNASGEYGGYGSEYGGYYGYEYGGYGSEYGGYYGYEYGGYGNEYGSYGGEYGGYGDEYTGGSDYTGGGDYGGGSDYSGSDYSGSGGG
jgi:hypothetical protein